MVENHQDTKKAHQLDHADGDRRVVVTTADQDRFVTTVQLAVEALQLYENRKVISAEIEKMFSVVADWAHQNADRIHSVYVGSHELQIVAFVIPAADYFDFDLAAKVAELSQTLSRQFPKLQTDALEVIGETADHVGCFVNQQQAIMVYGPSSKSPRKVDE